MYYIYYYKSPSNKYYIGITSNPERRQQEHRKKEFNGDETKIGNAIKKYSYDNLEYGILEKVKSEEIAKSREIYYIEFYDSYKNGYNSTLGGDLSITNRKLTKKQIIEILAKLEENNLTQKQICKLYNVSESTISDIKRSKRWNNILGNKKIKRKNMIKKGSTNSESKLTEEKVKEIKIKLSQGVSRKNLVKEYNVSKTNIQMIATNSGWKHVKVKEYTYKKIRNGNAKLDENKVREIWKDRKNGLTQKELWIKYNVSRSTIQNILKGKIWKDIYKEVN